MWGNSNDERETIVRSNNDIDNTNRIFDRNNNTANATVENSGNSSVTVNINIDDEEDDD